MSEFTKNRQEQQIPTASIPFSNDNPTICDLLIYSVEYTEAAKKRAKEEEREVTITDGFTVKMAITDYYIGNKKYNCIDYRDINNIKFPCDLVAADGSKQYCGIQNNEFMNVMRLTRMKGRGAYYGKFAIPSNEKVAVLDYDISFGLQYGLPEGILTQLLIELGLSKLKYEQFEELKKPNPLLFPIVTTYRFVDMDYPPGTWKKDANGVWSKPDDAVKNRPVVEYTTYNKVDKKNDLVCDTSKFISNETCVAIMEALRLRSKEKKDSEVPF